MGIVNLLAGKKLIVNDYEDYELAEDDPTAMAMGTDGKSATLYPKSIDVGDFRFFDLPGFNDTDGSERNLVNAAFIRQILLDAESVRLVYVAGQDQFTADKSASVRQMFNAIRQLFVIGEENFDPVQEGLFVATKIRCPDTVNFVDFLLRKTDSEDKKELNQQLQSWAQSGRVCRMFHADRDEMNREMRNQILEQITRVRPIKIRGINVSALYPPETKSDLERMFSNMMEEALGFQLKKPIAIVSEYDREIAAWTAEDFWKVFGTGLCENNQAVDLLKEFCITPYNKAFVSFEKDSEAKRQTHSQLLINKRQKRICDIKERTATKTQEVITSLVPRQDGNGLVPFDFAYHKDFYNQVCGADFITRLATDPTEQEIIRHCYADLISQHSHQQMMDWMQRFSGMADITRRLALLERAREPAVLLRAPSPEVQIEAIIQRFRAGKLIYKPNADDTGKLERPIDALANPLDGTFDLSGCGDTTYLSIHTGYRKQKSNANKLEIWFALRCQLEKDLLTAAAHLAAAITPGGKPDDVIVFWNWGTEEISLYDHYAQSMGDKAENGMNLYEKLNQATRCACGTHARSMAAQGMYRSFMFHF